MKITEKDINELYKAMKCCKDGKDGRSCDKCPFRTDFNCIAKLEHKVTELYKSEHPEIYDSKDTKKAETVEVVRCKDCIYRCIADFGQFEVSYCELHSSKWAYHVGENDYCSRAKRKG